MDKGMPNRWLIGFGIIGILPILPLLVVIIFTSSNDTKILPPIVVTEVVQPDYDEIVVRILAAIDGKEIVVQSSLAGPAWLDGCREWDLLTLAPPDFGPAGTFYIQGFIETCDGEFTTQRDTSIAEVEAEKEILRQANIKLRHQNCLEAAGTKYEKDEAVCEYAAAEFMAEFEGPRSMAPRSIRELVQ